MPAVRSTAVVLALNLFFAAATDCADGTCGAAQDQEEAALLQHVAARAAKDRALLQRAVKECESLSESDATTCPDVKGGSGEPINTGLKCVYNPGCTNGTVSLGCFEQTGCQYKNAALLQRAVEECESLSESDATTCPDVKGGSGEPINTGLKCVYNPGCTNGTVSLGCFEQTGCQYKNAALLQKAMP